MEENKIKNQLDEINGKMDIKEIEFLDIEDIKEKQDIEGIKKFKYFLLLSLLWPITAKFKE